MDVLGGGNKIMFNQGDATFAPTSYTNISVGAVGDLNNDGFLDIQNGNTIRYAVPNANNWLKITLNGIQSNSNGIVCTCANEKHLRNSFILTNFTIN